jgi:hypothetical protein
MRMQRMGEKPALGYLSIIVQTNGLSNYQMLKCFAISISSLIPFNGKGPIPRTSKPRCRGEAKRNPEMHGSHPLIWTPSSFP